jgi:hypothetical protein
VARGRLFAGNIGLDSANSGELAVEVTSALLVAGAGAAAARIVDGGGGLG